MGVQRLLPLLTLAGVVCAASLPEEETLRQIHLLFRHGQRTPADTYPTDPHINETFSPFGWGQLTSEGKMQQYMQGKYIRGLYDDFLGKKFSTLEVEARTTGVDRTKMSMSLMMAGLWPPKGDQVWNNDLLWQPVPYSSQELSKDTLILVRSCPRYAEAMEDLLKNNEEVKKEIESHKELYEYLEEHTGRKVSNPEDVQDVYSTLKAEEDFKLTLPEWTSKVYPKEMHDVTAYSFVLNAYTTEMQKIKAGPLIKKVIHDCEEMAHGNSKKKLIAYAGHDSSISNFMMGLKVWDTQVPVYNIMTMIELHQIEGQFGIKVFLRNTTSHDPYIMKIPGCEEFCPLDQLKKIVEPIMPDEHGVMCQPKNPDYKPGAEGGP